MTDWLRPVVRALDERRTPLALFIRDDDAGWDDERLYALLDVVADRGLAVDLAVIPTAVRPALVAEIATRIARGDRVGVHQHGYTHANHEPVGRKCEFGPSRSAAVQASDVAAGQTVLRRCFGDLLDPIFTPPWNRCTGDTVAAVRAAGLRTLSRDRSADPVDLDGLSECTVNVDWFATQHGSRLSPEAWAVYCASVIRAADRALGLMLHHAVTTLTELRRIDDVLAIFATHPVVRSVAMRDVATRPAAREWRMTCAR